MPISYQKLFALLEEKGWTTYRIRKEKLIGQGTLTALKKGTGGLDSKTIARICKVLNCQPGDIMEYVPDWVENRILELMELREEELREWYENQWSMDDSFEENLAIEYCEKYLPREIDALGINDDIDTDYINALREVNFDFFPKLIEKSWRIIADKYPSYFQDIEQFFIPYLKEYNEKLENEHQEFVNESVERDLNEEKADIEKQAFDEYFSNSER